VSEGERRRLSVVATLADFGDFGAWTLDASVRAARQSPGRQADVMKRDNGRRGAARRFGKVAPYW